MSSFYSGKLKSYPIFTTYIFLIDGITKINGNFGKYFGLAFTCLWVVFYGYNFSCQIENKEYFSPIDYKHSILETI